MEASGPAVLLAKKPRLVGKTEARPCFPGLPVTLQRQICFGNFIGS